MTDPVLCYVKDQWAWFTTQPLSDQWGDDWNDAPYEHNAGDPYGPVWHNLPEYVEKRGELCRCGACVRDWNEDGTPKWRVYKIAWDGSFEEPCASHWNSPYSVQAINQGAAPWLASESVKISAGVTMVEFCELIRCGGGTVYLPWEAPISGGREDA